MGLSALFGKIKYLLLDRRSQRKWQEEWKRGVDKLSANAHFYISGEVLNTDNFLSERSAFFALGHCRQKIKKSFL